MGLLDIYNNAKNAVGNFVQDDIVAPIQNEVRQAPQQISNAYSQNIAQPISNAVNNFSRGDTGWQQSAQQGINNSVNNFFDGSTGWQQSAQQYLNQNVGQPLGEYGGIGARSAFSGITQPGVAGTGDEVFNQMPNIPTDTRKYNQGALDNFNMQGHTGTGATIANMAGGTLPYLIPGLGTISAATTYGGQIGNLSENGGLIKNIGQVGQDTGELALNTIQAKPIKALESLGAIPKYLAKTSLAAGENVVRGQGTSILEEGKFNPSQIPLDAAVGAGLHTVLNAHETKDAVGAGIDKVKQANQNKNDFEHLAAATHTYNADPNTTAQTTTKLVNGVPVNSMESPNLSTITVPESQGEKILRTHNNMEAPIVDTVNNHEPKVTITYNPDTKSVVSWNAERPEFVQSIQKAANQGGKFAPQRAEIGNDIQQTSSKIRNMAAVDGTKQTSETINNTQEPTATEKLNHIYAGGMLSSAESQAKTEAKGALDPELRSSYEMYRDLRSKYLDIKDKAEHSGGDYWSKKAEQLKPQVDRARWAVDNFGQTENDSTIKKLGNNTGTQGKPLEEPLRDNNPDFNVNKYNVTPENKQILSEKIDAMHSLIKDQMGGKMSLEEMAAAGNDPLRGKIKNISREDTLSKIGDLTGARQELAASLESGNIDADFVKKALNIKSMATDTARTLNSFKNVADPAEKTMIDQILTDMNKKGVDIDLAAKAAEKYDLNDPKQAAQFYREFIKPRAKDWLDLLRYNSMLSSPNTHINNASGNLLNSALVKPIEKTVAGGVDFLSSGISGGERGRYAGEGAAYSRGYFSKVGEAAHAFADSMAGRTPDANLDTRNIPLAPGGGFAGGAEKTLSYPMKLLEASDQFFTAMAEGGETSALEYRQKKSGNLIPDISAQAKDQAAYQLFRQDTHPEGQGHVLNSIDDVTNKLQELRSSSNPVTATIAKFTVPFIKTPMNIFKQGIEYSPLGVSTLAGSSDKVGQIAKAAIGTAVFSGAATLLGSGRLSWAAPTGAKEKAEWDAAHRQAYSVKIGDTWVAFNKLPPGIAFPMALVASIDDMEKNGKLDATTTDKVLIAVASYGGFLADQSYAQGIGNILQAAKGGENGIAKIIAGNAQQLVPYRALMGWMARATDPLQREVAKGSNSIDKQVQLMMMQIPGLSQNTQAKTDEYGKPIENSDRFINAVSPVKISTENKEGAASYDAFKEQQRMNQDAQVQKKQLTGEATSSPVTVPVKAESASPANADIRSLANGKFAYKDSEGVVKTAPTKERAQLDWSKDQVASGKQEKMTVGDKYITLDDNGAVVVKSVKAMKVATDKATYALNLETAIRSNDLKGYNTLQEQQLQQLDAQRAELLKDPTLNSAAIVSNKNQAQNIQDQAAKFAAQGYTTKTPTHNGAGLNSAGVPDTGRGGSGGRIANTGRGGRGGKSMGKGGLGGSKNSPGRAVSRGMDKVKSYHAPKIAIARIKAPKIYNLKRA